MFARTALLAVLLCASSAPRTADAPWNASGHRILSALTWNELKPGTREAITALLKQHPRYRADLLAGLEGDPGAESTARYAFGAAANWPDTVRSPSNPLSHDHNHPAWHYINLPFVLEGQAVDEKPAKEGEGPRDVVEALHKCVADLRNQDLPAAERAIALCWVLHLTEDIHQPLHACTLFSKQFPQGDRGGNSFLVTRSPFDRKSVTNLHALWDSMLGSYASCAIDDCVATGIAAQQHLARRFHAEQIAIRDPARWAEESHEVAVTFVYRDGTLRGVRDGEAGTDQPPLLPEDYLRVAEGVALQRGVLAAYRLADLLEDCFAGH
ncbi:MAG: S1/P1 nuclease [Planctomycetota bacterium]